MMPFFRCSSAMLAEEAAATSMVPTSTAATAAGTTTSDPSSPTHHQHSSSSMSSSSSALFSPLTCRSSPIPRLFAPFRRQCRAGSGETSATMKEEAYHHGRDRRQGMEPQDDGDDDDDDDDDHHDEAVADEREKERGHEEDNDIESNCKQEGAKERLCDHDDDRNSNDDHDHDHVHDDDDAGAEKGEKDIAGGNDASGTDSTAAVAKENSDDRSCSRWRQIDWTGDLGDGEGAGDDDGNDDNDNDNDNDNDKGDGRREVASGPRQENDIVAVEDENDDGETVEADTRSLEDGGAANDNGRGAAPSAVRPRRRTAGIGLAGEAAATKGVAATEAAGKAATVTTATAAGGIFQRGKGNGKFGIGGGRFGRRRFGGKNNAIVDHADHDGSNNSDVVADVGGTERWTTTTTAAAAAAANVAAVGVRYISKSVRTFSAHLADETTPVDVDHDDEDVVIDVGRHYHTFDEHCNRTVGAERLTRRIWSGAQPQPQSMASAGTAPIEVYDLAKSSPTSASEMLRRHFLLRDGVMTSAAAAAAAGAAAAAAATSTAACDAIRVKNDDDDDAVLGKGINGNGNGDDDDDDDDDDEKGEEEEEEGEIGALSFPDGSKFLGTFRPPPPPTAAGGGNDDECDGGGGDGGGGNSDDNDDNDVVDAANRRRLPSPLAASASSSSSSPSALSSSKITLSPFRGTLVRPDETYRGEFDADGLYSGGCGQLAKRDGTAYEGSFRAGLYHGEGRLNYPDGSVYAGQFKDGKRDGEGTYKAEGEAAIGALAIVPPPSAAAASIASAAASSTSDSVTGVGVEVDGAGSAYKCSYTYSGMWSDNVPHGYGVQTHRRSHRYRPRRCPRTGSAEANGNGNGNKGEGTGGEGEGNVVVLVETYRGHFRFGLRHGRGSLSISSDLVVPTSSLQNGDDVDDGRGACNGNGNSIGAGAVTNTGAVTGTGTGTIAVLAEGVWRNGLPEEGPGWTIDYGDGRRYAGSCIRNIDQGGAGASGDACRPDAWRADEVTGVDADADDVGRWAVVIGVVPHGNGSMRYPPASFPGGDGSGKGNDCSASKGGFRGDSEGGDGEGRGGAVYNGQFRSGKRHGFGSFVRDDGETVEGMWADDNIAPKEEQKKEEEEERGDKAGKAKEEEDQEVVGDEFEEEDELAGMAEIDLVSRRENSSKTNGKVGGGSGASGGVGIDLNGDDDDDGSTLISELTLETTLTRASRSRPQPPSDMTPTSRLARTPPPHPPPPEAFARSGSPEEPVCHGVVSADGDEEATATITKRNPTHLEAHVSCSSSSVSSASTPLMSKPALAPTPTPSPPGRRLRMPILSPRTITPTSRFSISLKSELLASHDNAAGLFNSHSSSSSDGSASGSGGGGGGGGGEISGGSGERKRGNVRRMHEYPNGDTYRGLLDENGMRQGFGLFQRASKDDGVGGGGSRAEENDSKAQVGAAGGGGDPPGYSYEGDYLDDYRHGHGVEVVPGVSKYTGGFQFDRREGEGTLVNLSDGSMYKGHFREGLFHGRGTLCASNGSVYEGSFARGVKEGRGEEERTAAVPGSSSTENGGMTLVYRGHFREGDRNGRGVLLRRRRRKCQDRRWDEGGTEEEVLYDGQWKDGLFHGWGVLYFRDDSTNCLCPSSSDECVAGCCLTAATPTPAPTPSSSSPSPSSPPRFEGTFRGGIRHGVGTLHRPDGSSLSGPWIDDAASDGTWTVRRASDGAVEYEGGAVWHHDLQDWSGGRGGGAVAADELAPDACPVPHGRGTKTYPNGDVYKGEFVHGMREGSGSCAYANGERWEGTWMNDLCCDVGCEGRLGVKDGTFCEFEGVNGA